AGLASLFDEIYAATSEEVEREQPLKDRAKREVAPIRIEERLVPDKNGKERIKKLYVYPQTIPTGSFLSALDRKSDGKSGSWIKLWRDLVWGVLRAVPATRGPFETRAAGEAPTDVDRVWAELSDGRNPSLELPSTYFVGAQAMTAEAVGFTDRARQM